MNEGVKFALRSIELRRKKGDSPKDYAVRLSKWKPDKWSEFSEFSERCLDKYNYLPIDGVKIKFKTVTLIINNRH